LSSNNLSGNKKKKLGELKHLSTKEKRKESDFQSSGEEMKKDKKNH